MTIAGQSVNEIMIIDIIKKTRERNHQHLFCILTEEKNRTVAANISIDMKEIKHYT
jgi:hypothetical protein